MPFPSKYSKCSEYLDIKNQKGRAYRNAKPEGITIHYSAGVRLEGTINALEARSLGYHLIIERDGSVVQLTTLSKAVAHAGKAVWNGQSPNQQHLAVCLMSWGWLTSKDESYQSWTKAFINPDDVSRSPDIIGNQTYWHLATIAQMQSLEAICLWGMSQGIEVENICGHDEAALPKGRKVDPGGILGCTLQEFRQLLENAESKDPTKPKIS